MTLDTPQPFALEAELDKLEPIQRGAAAAFLAAHPPGAGAPVAIVIPAYNEEPTVGGVLEEIPSELAGLQTEVIIVVDGAQDATAERAQDAGALVCDVPVNVGQGVVLKLGYWLPPAPGGPSRRARCRRRPA